MTSSGLHIVTSNRMEILAAGLAELVRSPSQEGSAHSLCTETVLVQSKGMQRWVSMAIAKHNGICANLAFPFPNAFLQQLYASLIRDLSEYNPYDTEALSFHILRLFPELLHQEAFKPLQRYLSTNPSPLKQYQLARKLADLFDQYMVFRPDLLAAWETGQTGHQTPDAAWQSILWRVLNDKISSPNRAALQRALVRLLDDPRTAVNPELLPDRLSVFGISHLPPFHLEALKAVARRLPVYLFLLNPCRHFWFDIVSDHQKGRIRAQYESAPVEEDLLHLERGNRLLASLGHLGKQFFDRVFQNAVQTNEVFMDGDADSLLSEIQQDILELDDRTANDRASENRAEIRNDGTLRIQSCHSPMREVEILYDQILDILDHHPTIQPRDILVMTPHIGLYAPFVHAVFGAVDHGELKIPYSVADQNILSQSPAVEGFLQLLDLVGGRFEASRVMTLLENPSVYNRFGFSPADLPVVEKWIRAAGIQWGWDGSARKRQGLPGFKENTWRTGLDRLVLGYAMADEETERLFAGTLPYSGIGAGEGTILGRLLDFSVTLYDILESLTLPASPIQWHDRLTQALDRFFLIDPSSEFDMQAVRRSIQFLARMDGFDTPHTHLPFEVIRHYLAGSLDSISYESGFMAGGVTFCAMLPMRSIPAQVICMLGMNHDAFPRDQHEPGFNLISAEPRSGDRSKRNDDRYLFLETIISARKILYLSHVGRDIQDNAPIPPSVVVEELTDYVHEGWGIPREELVTQHPLHGFSPRYFNGGHPDLFSYSEKNERVAEQLSKPVQERFLFDPPLDPPEEVLRRSQWADLAAFFFNPARYLMEQRLGIRLRESSEMISDREIFVLDALQRYQVSQRLLRATLRGKGDHEIYGAIRAGGELPHGTVGKVLYDEINGEVMEFIGSLDRHIGKHPPTTELVELELPPFYLYGAIHAIYPDARIVCRLGNVRAKDLLEGFLYHLALQLASPSLPKRTVLICKNEIWHFGAVAMPEAVLKKYLTFYWQGMHAPLPFFSRTSFEYAKSILIKQRSPKEALAAAKAKWIGNDYSPGESEDLYLKRCFGDRDVMTSDFERIALEIFSPLFAAGSCISAGGVR